MLKLELQKFSSTNSSALSDVRPVVVLFIFPMSLGAEQLGLSSSGSIRMRRRSTSSTSAAESAQAPCRSLGAPSEAGMKASLHSSTPPALACF